MWRAVEVAWCTRGRRGGRPSTWWASSRHDVAGSGGDVVVGGGACDVAGVHQRGWRHWHRRRVSLSRAGSSGGARTSEWGVQWQIHPRVTCLRPRVTRHVTPAGPVTPTRQNPYPCSRVRFFAGRGTGRPLGTRGLPVPITTRREYLGRS
jgi:hypothetical protein